MLEAATAELNCITLSWRYAQGIIASLSIILLLMVVLLFASSKAMRVHPAPLICLISISECICLYHALVWSLDPVYFVDWWRIDWLFVKTTARSMDDIQSTNMELCRSNQRIYLFFQLLTLSLNTFFFLDVLYTLRRPFEPGRKRMWWYMLISLLVSCIGVLIDSSSSIYYVCRSIKLNPDSGYYNSTVTNFRVSGFVGILGLVFLFAGFYTIISSCFRLRTRQGMDVTYGVENVQKHKKARTKFMCKNISYMVVFFVVWFFPIVEGLKGTGSILKNGQAADESQCEDTDIILKICLISLLSNGILLGIVRISEPFAMKSLIRLLCFCCYKRQKRNDQQKEANKELETQENYLQDLHSCLKVELVNTILTGITTYSSGHYHELEERYCWCCKKSKPNKGPLYHTPATTIVPNLSNPKDVKKLIKEKIKIDLSDSPEQMGENVFTVYAPAIFQKLCNVFGVTSEIIMTALDPKNNQENMRKAGESKGRSGSFMFFSQNKNFIIKTMNSAQLGVFMSILPKYQQHVRKYKTRSLLGKILGVYTVKLAGVDPVNILMMENTLHWIDSSNIEYVFDLKGSKVHRFVDCPQERIHKEVLKDENFLKILRKRKLMKLEMELCKEISHQLKVDSDFLGESRLMDYSVLLGVEKNDRGMLRRDEFDIDMRSNKFISSDGQRIYHISIIDYLQKFDIQKMAEYLFKSAKNKGGKEISAVPPNFYKKRFQGFMFKYLFDMKEVKEQSKPQKSINILRKMFTQKK